MLTINIDFTTLADRQALYQTLIEQSGGDAAFGCNLDALWDWLTGGMALPARISLLGAENAETRTEFAPVIALLREAAQMLEGRLVLDAA